MGGGPQTGWMSGRTAGAVEWLLGSGEPAVRGMARRDLLGEEFGEDVLAGGKVQALLDARVTKHPYSKWTGAHWRSVAMVELEVPAGEPRAIAAAEQMLEALTRSRKYGVPVVNGLARRCGSMEGNSLAACSRLGLADDPRTKEMTEGCWSGSGLTVGGTATRILRLTGRRSTRRTRLLGGCTSIGGLLETRRPATAQYGLGSCSWSTGCSGGSRMVL